MATAVTLAGNQGDAIRNYTQDREALTLLVAEMSSMILSVFKFHGGEQDPVVTGEITEAIINTYPDMSPEEFAVFCKSCKSGKYGKYTFKTPGKHLNGAHVMTWLSEFQEARIDAMEEQAKKDKQLAADISLLEITKKALNGNVGDDFEKELHEKMQKVYSNLQNRRKGIDTDLRTRREEILSNQVGVENLLPWQWEHLYIQTGRNDCLEFMKNYWKETSVDDQIKEWVPWMYDWTKQGKEHVYLITNGDYKNQMFIRLAGIIKAEDEAAYLNLAAITKKDWIEELRKIGHQIGPELEKKRGGEIAKTLNPHLSCPTPEFFWRKALIIFYKENILE